MVETIEERFNFDKNYGKLVLEYNPNLKSDERIIHMINDLIVNEQPLCINCQHYSLGGVFCGYQDHICNIYGILDYPSNPHYDGDGSKCRNYIKEDKS